jgi:aminopeptidase N
MLHTIRQVVDDDALWRSILRGMNEQFRHQVVTGEQVQQYISQRAGRDLSPIFAQYLTTTRIPVLEYRVEGTTLSHRWAEVVPGFAMPVRIAVGDGEMEWIHPSETWQEASLKQPVAGPVRVDENFYVEVREGR